MRSLAHERAVRLRHRVLAAVAVLGLFGCAPSAELRGGSVVARGKEPAGVVLARYRSAGCVDAVGQPTRQARGNVWLVRGGDGVTRLVETVGGHDSLIVENSFVAGGERVFQLSTNALPEPLFLGSTSPRDDLLFDYRLPENGVGAGRLGLVRAWREERLDDGRVRAHFERAAMVCRLEPEPIQLR